ncbi:MAG: hypothetical protein HYV27_23325 [Candidatus Hydrogenedentes bacterium]|nr:hypothetical protein [Candidatus Hydrogenedentota bacterium]
MKTLEFPTPAAAFSASPEGREFRGSLSYVYLASLSSALGLLGFTAAYFVPGAPAPWIDDPRKLIVFVLGLLIYTGHALWKLWSTWRLRLRFTADSVLFHDPHGTDREILREDILRIQLVTTRSGKPKELLVITRDGAERSVGRLQDLPGLYRCMQSFAGEHRCFQGVPPQAHPVTLREFWETVPQQDPEKARIRKEHTRIILANLALQGVIIATMLYLTPSWTGLAITVVCAAICLKLLQYTWYKRGKAAYFWPFVLHLLVLVLCLLMLSMYCIPFLF